MNFFAAGMMVETQLPLAPATGRTSRSRTNKVSSRVPEASLAELVPRRSSNHGLAGALHLQMFVPL